MSCSRSAGACIRPAFAFHGRAADYVDRIMRGANPGELPVQPPTKFELVINPQTAKAVGLDVSPSLLDSADKVVE
jgi:putative ABC transport system substrate-binding protein